MCYVLCAMRHVMRHVCAVDCYHHKWIKYSDACAPSCEWALWWEDMRCDHVQFVYLKESFCDKNDLHHWPLLVRFWIHQRSSINIISRRTTNNIKLERRDDWDGSFIMVVRNVKDPIIIIAFHRSNSTELCRKRQFTFWRNPKHSPWNYYQTRLLPLLFFMSRQSMRGQDLLRSYQTQQQMHMTTVQ